MDRPEIVEQILKEYLKVDVTTGYFSFREMDWVLAREMAQYINWLEADNERLTHIISDAIDILKTK